jgi:hypothetical protein
VKRTTRIALACCVLLGLQTAGLAGEVDLHVGAAVFAADAAPYDAEIQLNCPSARPARVGVGGTFEGISSAQLAVAVNGEAAGTISIDGSAPKYWTDVTLPAGASHVQISGPTLAAGVRLEANYVGVVLTDDTGCTAGAACPEMAAVSLNCAGLEPFVCDLLGAESELYCKQLELDRVALHYQAYPNPTVDIWKPEDRAVYNRLSPQIDALQSRQRDLYGRLEELSRKQPRQLKGYLDGHRALETAYQRALAASR